jgi:hypothetical protein
VTTVRRSSLVLIPALALTLAACGGGGGNAASASAAPTGTASPSPSSAASGPVGPTGVAVAAGDDLCGLLRPGDFTAVGVDGTSGPTENNEDDKNVYCVFAGKSAGTGGVEFDAFLAANAGDAGATYQTVIGEVGGDPEAGKPAGAAAFPDADGATIVSDADGGGAVIVIWQGPLVFDIGIPASDQATAKLTALAALVLERASALT